MSAGMIATGQLEVMLRAVQRMDGKLVLVGDDRQAPEIEAGTFHGLLRRLPAIVLTENRRQVSVWERDALV